MITDSLRQQLGGVLGAELMPLEPYYALKYLVLVLAVVAVGGMGSLPGSLAAALVLGTVETASKYYASQWGSLFFFLAMATQWRCQSLNTMARATIVRTGLDYPALEPTARMIGLDLAADDFTRVRLMEGEALTAWREASEE